MGAAMGDAAHAHAQRGVSESEPERAQKRQCPHEHTESATVVGPTQPQPQRIILFPYSTPHIIGEKSPDAPACARNSASCGWLLSTHVSPANAYVLIVLGDCIHTRRRFFHVEQYMMWHKAALFGDTECMRMIERERDPQ